MNFFLAMSLCMTGTGQDAGAGAAQGIAEQRYWYGKPLKEGSFNDVRQWHARAALATMDAGERAALEKLTGVGFEVVDRFANTGLKVVIENGKKLDATPPPRGVFLRYDPSRKAPAPKTPALTPGDLAPLADLRHVVRLDIVGKFVGDAALNDLRNMEEHLWDLRLSSTRITDEGLKTLGRLKELQRLTIHRADITDAGVATIAAIRTLEMVRLESTRVTDVGMTALAKNGNLQEIELFEIPVLSKAAVGDKSVAALATMPSLRSLVLKGTRITDKGLAEMATPGNLTKLHKLDLSWTGVTDAGIKCLEDTRALPGLRLLYLDRTKVSSNALMSLFAARPELTIWGSYEGGAPLILRSTVRKR